MLILSQTLKKMGNIILWGIERLLWDTMGELQVKSKAVITGGAQSAERRSFLTRAREWGPELRAREGGAESVPCQLSSYES